MTSLRDKPVFATILRHWQPTTSPREARQTNVRNRGGGRDTATYLLPLESLDPSPLGLPQMSLALPWPKTLAVRALREDLFIASDQVLCATVVLGLQEHVCAHQLILCSVICSLRRIGHTCDRARHHTNWLMLGACWRCVLNEVSGLVTKNR